MKQEHREAIARLIFTRDGKLLYEYLQESLAAATDRLVNAKADEDVRIWQGHCRSLRTMIDLLNPVSQSE